MAAGLLLLPILSVLAQLFQGGGDAWAHLVGTQLLHYVGNTLLLLLGVAWGVISIGVLSAWLVTTYEFPGRRVLEWALLLPLAVPAYVMAYAYTDWLQFTGPVQTLLRSVTGWQAREYWFPEIRSLWGAAAMLSFALYPYVYLIVRTAFLELPRSAIEAGRLAGYGAWGSFFRVAVPLTRPAIVAGAALALMETLADFGTVSYFAVEVFTTAIFKAWFSMGEPVAAAQLSSYLLAFVAIVLTLERASRGSAVYHGLSARRSARRHALRGAGAVLALLACAAPVVFGFLLPAGILLCLALGGTGTVLGARLIALVGDSFAVAGGTALLAVALALVMAYGARLSRSALVAAACRVAGLGYALPGAVIAAGILVPLTRIDHALADWIERISGAPVGLILTGTLLALVYAYLVRLLAVALQATEAGLAKITPAMEDAARSLGASPLGTLARVHAPLLAASMMTAGLLVFVDVMKELPATFALRPFNFDTLAIEAYNLARDERLAEAAVPSLILVAIGLLPLPLLWRRLARAAPG